MIKTFYRIEIFLINGSAEAEIPMQGVSKLKAFVWNMSGLVPLSKPKELTLQ